MAAKVKLRARGVKYTTEEKQILMELVKTHIDVIETKNTTASMNKLKRVAWNDITIKFNELCTTGTRDSEQLKYLYENTIRKYKRGNNLPTNPECEDTWSSKIKESSAPIKINLVDLPKPVENNQMESESESESESDPEDLTQSPVVDTKGTEILEEHV